MSGMESTLLTTLLSMSIAIWIYVDTRNISARESTHEAAEKV